MTVVIKDPAGRTMEDAGFVPGAVNTFGGIDAGGQKWVVIEYDRGGEKLLVSMEVGLAEEVYRCLGHVLSVLKTKLNS